MINRKFLLFFLTEMFFLINTMWAQEPEQQNDSDGYYVIEQRYVQQLVWIGDEYTLKYEVVIEKNEDNVYKAYLQEFTEKPNLQVSLSLGKYRYRIIPYDYLEHPGEASDWENIEIKPAPIVMYGTDNRINLYVSAAWTPLISIYGRMQEIIGNDFYLSGATVRFGVLYNKLQWFSPGLELLTSWYSINGIQDKDKIDIQTGVTGFNIVAQKFLPNRMAVTLKAGTAVLYQVSEIYIEDYSYTRGKLIHQLNFEASFLWFAYKQLYLEAGLGFFHIIIKDDNSGCLRPWLGAGWQF